MSAHGYKRGLATGVLFALKCGDKWWPGVCVRGAGEGRCSTGVTQVRDCCEVPAPSIVLDNLQAFYISAHKEADLCVVYKNNVCLFVCVCVCVCVCVPPPLPMPGRFNLAVSSRRVGYPHHWGVCLCAWLRSVCVCVCVCVHTEADIALLSKWRTNTVDFFVNAEEQIR